MNIWFFSTYEQPRGHTSRTYNYCQELMKRGHKTTLFTNSYSHRTHEDCLPSTEKWRIENIDGIRVVWLRTIHYTGNGFKRGLNMLSFGWRAMRIANTLPDAPDVVIGDSVPPTAGLAAAQVACQRDAAFVYQIRDVWPISLVYGGALSTMNPVYHAFRYIEKYLYRKSHRICATIPFLHQHVLESGSNPDKITYVPNGVNTDMYRGFDSYDGGVRSPLVAMYVGAFGFAHDVTTIVRAARILQQKGNNNYRFVLVGDGVRRAECEREAAVNSLSNIEFRNSVPKSEVPRLQSGADILIASVRDSQVYRFGINLNKLYDYFASGRPVIFAGNAPNDPVAHSGGGFSVPPENPEAMVEALEKYQAMSPSERRALGKSARLHAEKEFNVCKHAGRMEELLYKAIREKSKRNAPA